MGVLKRLTLALQPTQPTSFNLDNLVQGNSPAQGNGPAQGNSPVQGNSLVQGGSPVQGNKQGLTPFGKVDHPKSRQQTSQSSRRKRPASSQEHPSSSQDNRQRRHSRIPPLTALEEEVPEDGAIRTDISTLSTLIDQHAENFYINRELVRGTITETILTDIVKGSGNETDVSQELSDRLQPYVQSPAGPTRDAHLLQLCEMAGRVRDMINRHPSEWTFGRWDTKSGAMLFPSVSRDYTEFMSAEYM